MAQFLKATGATVLGGNTCTPDRGMLSALDPQNSYARVHNRYARVCFVAGNESGIRFQLRGPDYYEVILPNQPQIFEALKVRYILLVDLPETASIVGFKQIASKDGLALLQRD